MKKGKHIKRVHTSNTGGHDNQSITKKEQQNEEKDNTNFFFRTRLTFRGVGRILWRQTARR